jgi:50S ribosomal protein L16 3-hydroxylase
MTCSIGMRAPHRGALAAELVQRLAENNDDARLYRDAGRPAARRPAAIPAELASFAMESVRSLVTDRAAVARALGEVLSEPKPHVWFTQRRAAARPGAVALDRRTRMLYDAHRIFINGESMTAAGKDRSLLRRLADERALDAAGVRRLSRAARALLGEWLTAGWAHPLDDASPHRKSARHRRPPARRAG